MLEHSLDRMSYARHMRHRSAVDAQRRLYIPLKAATYGPPGLATPQATVSHSEGREVFFNYDGTWLDGHMNGHGESFTHHIVLLGVV